MVAGSNPAGGAATIGTRPPAGEGFATIRRIHLEGLISSPLRSAVRSNIAGVESASGGPKQEQAGIVVSIGTLNEGHLHASLRARYVEPGDGVEVGVDGYVVDILRGDLIIEVQTANFSAIAGKMRDLVSRHPVRLVYPIPRDLWIIKSPQNKSGCVTRRKSPKHLEVIDVFDELVSFPELIAHPNFQLDVVLTGEEKLQSFDGRKRWRRGGWVTVERRLLEVYETVSLRNRADYMSLIPIGLPEAFLTSDLASALGRPRNLAQKVAYCLRNSGLIEQVGSKGNGIVYSKIVP